ncbi:hypothetical protein M422DRAFT_257731 [Sphaerobolus stellatus SS14]|uniref:Uncharacterized protein n=1 Tax=Sphaerobolus stellatus (strain SS14) TaxID=990650 RepID=A0A0C9VNU7_SPHS4|nr:hypothetical protein M422DRAFT_257731 [Sphaerobolus stellatus SS14]
MRLADDIRRSLYQFDSTSYHAVIRLYRQSEMAERLNVDKDVFYEEDDVGGAVLERMFEEGGDKTVLGSCLHLHNPRARTRTALCPSHGTDIRARAGGERKKDGAEAALGPEEEVGMEVDLGGNMRWTAGKMRGRRPTLLSTRPSFPTTGTTTSRTSFPKVKPHAPNTVQTPARSTLTFRGRLKQRLWALRARIKEPDMKYNVRFKDNTSVELIGFRRATAVIIGVIWAFMVSQFWWRTEARRELGKELSDFCFNIGWLYNHLVANCSCPPESLLRIPQADSRFTTAKKTAPNTPAGGRSPERTPLINGQATRSTPGILNNYSSMNDSNDILIRARTGLPPKASDQLLASIPDFMAMCVFIFISFGFCVPAEELLTECILFKELHLQQQLIRLEELLAQTQHEPGLKGPFPVSCIARF